MKKVLLILGFLLVSLICIGQVRQYVPKPSEVVQMNITHNQAPDANGWAKMGDPCAGCPAYWYKIQRSIGQIIAEDGIAYYYFFFYFYSNSHYTDGTIASTYLSDVQFFSEETFITTIPYIIIIPDKQEWGAWLRTQNPSAAVQFLPTKVTVF